MSIMELLFNGLRQFVKESIHKLQPHQIWKIILFVDENPHDYLLTRFIISFNVSLH